MSNKKVNLNSNGKGFPDLSFAGVDPVPAQQTSAPRLAAFRTYISFGEVSVYASQSQLISFQNLGDRPLVIRNLQVGNTAYRLSDTGFRIPPGETRLLRITFAPSFAQTYSTQVSFETNDSQQPTGSIFLTGRGVSR